MLLTIIPQIRSILLVLSFVVVVTAVHAQSFKTPTDYAVGDNPNGGAAADFNGDGKPDLAIGNVLNKSGASCAIMETERLPPQSISPLTSIPKRWPRVISMLTVK